MLASQQTDLDMYSPLQNLFAQYRSDKSKVEQIVQDIDSKAAEYFFKAATVNKQIGYISVGEVFQLEPAIKAIDATYWQRAMAMTDVLEAMPADKRNKWHEQIRSHKTPSFEFDSVIATMREMLASRERFMAERVDGLFCNLSHEHVTNCPQGFGKRFIINYMLSYGSISWDRSSYIHDLRVVIAKFMGREGCSSNSTHTNLCGIGRDGQWNYFDGGALKIRLYKKGTVHLEVHPDMAWRLNQVLAYLHPMAIPNEFRTPPKRKLKEFEMRYDLIGFDVLSDLENLRSDSTDDSWYFSGCTPSDRAEKVLEYIGGIKIGFRWNFDYDVKLVLKEIKRYGAIPEQKSHQYYPTPENVARDVIEIADIQQSDLVLEPSAGQGAIADLIKTEFLYLIDISKLHCEVLKAKGYDRVLNIDFMTYVPAYKFDKIIMNPPFSESRAISHVKHAATMLSEKGKIVAVLPAGYRSNKVIVEGMSHEWSGIYKNEFAGTSIDTVILILKQHNVT